MSFIQDLIAQIEETSREIVSTFAPISASKSNTSHIADEYGTDHEQHNFTGSTRLHGIDVPNKVYYQLRERGVMLESYSADEVRMAIRACEVDSTLIDDPDGTDFQDQLLMEDSERKDIRAVRATESNTQENSWTQRVGKKATQEINFQQLIEESREKAHHNPDFPE